MSGTVNLAGNDVEQGVSHRHEHGRRNTLAGNVSNTEKQFPVAGIKVKNISAYFPGRLQGAINIRRKVRGEHFLLDLIGYSQFSTYPGLLFGRFQKVPLILGVSVNNKTKNEHA